LEDRELNQARSKPDTVDIPVRTARIFVHHYNSTQYCKTETVFSIFPFLQTNITSLFVALSIDYNVAMTFILNNNNKIKKIIIIIIKLPYMWDFQPHLIQWTTWPTKAVLPQHVCDQQTNQPTSSTLCVTRSPRQFQAALLCRVVVSSAHVRYSTTEQSRSCNETLIYQRCTNGTLSNNHHLLTHNKKLSSRRETGQRFVSLSFEMTLLNKTCVFLLAFC